MNLKEFIEKHCYGCDFWMQDKANKTHWCDTISESGLKRMELCIRLLTSEGINP